MKWLLCKNVLKSVGQLENSHRKEQSNEDWWNIFAFRWCIPLGARRIMNAVKDGHKSTLTSGKMVAVAAGLTLGATVGYIIYRHVSISKTSECCWEGSMVVTLTFGDQWWSMLSCTGQGSNAEMSKMTLPLEVYRNLSRYQAKFLDMVSHFLPENSFSFFLWDVFQHMQTKSPVSWLTSGDPEIRRSCEHFLRRRGIWLSDCVFPAARVQGAGVIGSLCPAEPGHWLRTIGGGFGGPSDCIWAHNR